MLPVCPCRGGTGDSSRSETPKVGFSPVARNDLAGVPLRYTFFIAFRRPVRPRPVKANPPYGSL